MKHVAISVVLVYILAAPVWAGDYTVTLTPTQEAEIQFVLEADPLWQRTHISPTVAPFAEWAQQTVHHEADRLKGNARGLQQRALMRDYEKMTPAEKAQVDAVRDIVKGRR